MAHRCRDGYVPDGFPRLKDEPKRTRKTVDAFKTSVLKAAGWRCEWFDDDGRCFRRATEAHHVVRRSRGGSDDPKLGRALCLEQRLRDAIRRADEDGLT
jgi:hypothetical protein